MRKIVLIGVAIVIFLLTISASAEGLTWEEIFENEEVEFQKMHTTAYMVSGITATGVHTHPGVCACNPRHGEIAIVYTLDGEYLGQFECVDSGDTEGLRAGRVIDVWFETYEECKAWMTKTKGKVMVQWVSGEG